MPFNWNPDTEAKLLQYEAQGIPRREIGKLLSVSPSAVKTKINRLKRGIHAKPALKKKECRATRHVIASQKTPQTATAPKVVEDGEPVRDEAGAFYTLPTLPKGACKWPVGDPKDADFHYCGCKQKPDSPYCESHHARAYVVGSNKPREAHVRLPELGKW
jgi:GcrA cell cycle regulator